MVSGLKPQKEWASEHYRDMSNPDSWKPLEDELTWYREVITREIQSHRLFSRITVLTGLGLVALGGAIAFYSADYATLGFLLLLVGALRFLNTFYDLQREDSLKRSLRALDEKLGRRGPR